MKETNTYPNSSKPEHLDENELAQYAEFLRHETDQIPEKLIDHVASCSYCRAELMAITDMLDTLPDIAEEPVQPVVGYQLPVTGRPRATGIKLLRTAAAVAAVVLLAWVVQQLVPHRPMNEPVATNKQEDTSLKAESLNPDSSNPSLRSLPSDGSLASNATNPSAKIAALPDTVRYAAAFVPNPVYENLMGAKYRSGSDPRVVGPQSVSVFAPGDTLKISWTPDPAEEYVITIIDNKANPVKEMKPGSAASFAWKIDLKPGLYYWKFLGKEEMWKVGKMKVIGSATRR